MEPQTPNAAQQTSSSERPVIALSVRLIDTYREINRRYYEARNKQAAVETSRAGTFNDGYDDEYYDYIVEEGELFANRYILKTRVGKGSFGQVVSAYDNIAKKDVVIKIIKSKKPFYNQSQTEKELLKLIQQAGGCESHNLVELIDHFVYRNHQCFVFELLAYNLYDLLKHTRFRGVSLNLIRKFAKQILVSLEFLSQPHINIIHCDLKPENILLRHPKRSALKLIDFGSSCIATKKMYTYVQSRFYRSPEVLLGISYDQKIDIWSLACVLVEMHTGEPLFGGLDQVDQLCRIIDVLGMPPVTMLERSPQKVFEKFFEKVENGDDISMRIPCECDPECNALSSDGRYVYFLRRPPNRDQPARRTLADIIGVYTFGPTSRRRGESGHSEDKYLEFLDFILQMLIYEPALRVSPIESSRHIFLGQRMMATQSDTDGMSGRDPSIFGSSAFASGAVDSSMEFDGRKAGGENLSGKRRERDPAAERLRSKSAPVVTVATTAKDSLPSAPVFQHSSAEESLTTVSVKSSDDSGDRDDDGMDVWT